MTESAKRKYERNGLTIEATAEIGKSISAKAEKVGDDEVTVAHLKFKGLFVDREAMDLLIGWQKGRAALALFDEEGEPRAYFQLVLAGDFDMGGSIAGNAETNEKLVVTVGTLSNAKLDLCPLGALLSGKITWKAAGDEVSDAEPLLGKLCMAKFVVRGMQQLDLFREAA